MFLRNNLRMKTQQFELAGGVKAFVAVYKVHPWVRLGYPELPTSEDTNSFLMGQIGSEVAQVIKELVHGKLNTATARWRVKEALHSIGYWPNPKVPAAKRDERADAWIEGMLNTSTDSA